MLPGRVVLAVRCGPHWGRMPPPQVAVWKPPVPRIRQHAVQKSRVPVMRINPRVVQKSPIAAMARRMPAVRINPPLVLQTALPRRGAARTNPRVVLKSVGHCWLSRSRVSRLGRHALNAFQALEKIRPKVPRPGKHIPNAFQGLEHPSFIVNGLKDSAGNTVRLCAVRAPITIRAHSAARGDTRPTFSRMGNG